MKEDFLEETIKKAFKEKIDKPKEYKLAIQNALNNENRTVSWEIMNIIKNVKNVLVKHLGIKYLEHAI